MTMDRNVDVFAANIRKDSRLAGGFNCVGFSQGNSLCRGYIQKYNNPPVRNFLSVHGTVVGVAGFPNCNPAGLLGPVCDVIARVCGDLAYTTATQDLLFQADYFRDPMRVHTDAYKTHSQLATWNNEGNSVNATYKANFVSVSKFIMVKALADTMIFPNEGEHWGHFADGARRPWPRDAPARHRAAPRRAAPRRTAPHRAAPRRTAPHRAAPRRTAQRRAVDTPR
jgi:palmitoyl-protein thioesterase